eukprot:m.149407 g.149407  ORF g.149407 m.149407 type:complete len:431 (+) comp17814_c0_seq14:131-1423(+)
MHEFFKIEILFDSTWRVMMVIMMCCCYGLALAGSTSGMELFSSETRLEIWHNSIYAAHIPEVQKPTDRKEMLNQCGGSRRTRPKSNIKMPQIIMASFHKSGTMASGELAKILNASHNFYYGGFAKPYSSPTVVFTRNPFDLILSGYEYHKKCSEHTYGAIFGSREEVLIHEARVSGNPRKSHGLRQVALSAHKVFPHIDPIKLTEESYCGYLQRLSFQEGIAIEMYRVSWFPLRDMLQSVRCETGEDMVHRVCLNDLMSNATRTVSGIVDFLIQSGDNQYKIPAAQEVVRTYTSIVSAPQTQRHTTKYAPDVLGYTKQEAHNLMRRLDQTTFTSIFSLLEQKEKCVSSVPIENPRDRTWYNPALNASAAIQIRDALDSMPVSTLVQTLHQCQKAIFEPVEPFEAWREAVLQLPMDALQRRVQQLCLFDTF